MADVKKSSGPLARTCSLMYRLASSTLASVSEADLGTLPASSSKTASINSGVIFFPDSVSDP